MSGFIKILNSVANSKTAKFGLPFFILVLGGSYGLSFFTSLRYEYSKVTKLTPEESEIFNKLKKPEEVTLESEYEKIKKLDIDSWTNIRGPRPWETPESTDK